MRRVALTIATVATMAAPLAGAELAHAGGYTVRACHAQAPAPPGLGRGWSLSVGGSAISNNANPAAWLDVCQRYRNNVSTWGGIGGAFGDTALAGSYGFVRFTPPAGAAIARVSGLEDLLVTTGAYAEAGIFASSGRSLSDQSDHLAGGGESNYHQVSYEGAALGVDGAQGLLFGGRCPVALPPEAGGYCGGAGAAFTELELFIDDPTQPVVDASLNIDANGVASLTWSASDPQSGIADVTVTRQGNAPTVQPFSCTPSGAPACEPSATGSSKTQLAEGETATFVVAGRNVWSGTSSKTVSVTRPKGPGPGPGPTAPQPTTPVPGPTTPQPTTPPPTTPPPAASKLTLHTKAQKGRKLRLSGSAKGCTKVRISTPGSKRTKFASVKRGRWSLTVARKRGTYRATCGTASAKRFAR